MNPDFEAIKANLFPAAHAAIEDWHNFPWHKSRSGAVDTHQANSSQALAIDVFGTIKGSKDRNQILSALAMKCGVPTDGRWELELEWVDTDNLLREPKQTQVDAIALGQSAVLLIECKFTETGGTCSQSEPIRKGPHRGLLISR
jgi:hypothetical protein